jgi:hypothetical protein
MPYPYAFDCFEAESAYENLTLIVQDFQVRIKSQLHLPSLPVCGTIAPVKRWILFIFWIAIGITIGLLIGWKVAPVKYTNTSLANLRQDYKADYILMIAEAYQIETNPTAAAKRLADLSAAPPLELIHDAVLFAEEIGYDDHDLTKLRMLQRAIAASTSPPVGNSP